MIGSRLLLSAISCSFATTIIMSYMRRSTAFSTQSAKKVLFPRTLNRPRNNDIATAAHSASDESKHSRPFYKALGSPQNILAPMVAQSDLPFRLMCEQLYNVDLSYTQMIHAFNFAETNADVFRRHHLDIYSHSLVQNVLLGKVDRGDIVLSTAQKNALEGLSESDVDASRRRILNAISQSGRMSVDIKPTVAQIAGHDPKVAVEAALLILEKSGSCLTNDGEVSPIAAIDLNLGELSFMFK